MSDIRRMNTKYVFEFFPEEYVALQRELATGYHQPIVSIIQKHLAEDIDVKLAQIASYCEVALDGAYTLEDRIKLCKILRERLILKRIDPTASKIILPV